MSWLDRRRADMVLASKARAIARDITQPRRLRRRARAVWILFALRVALRWHSRPSRHLAFAWHGRHCGPNHGRSGVRPVDELDSACADHDAWYR